MSQINLYLPLVCFIITFGLTCTLEKLLIPYLTSRAKQPIYEGGPEWHMSKSGTPTMGGIGFLVSAMITLFGASMYLLYTSSAKFGISIIISLLYAVGNALVGVFDDITKLKRKENAGLSPLQKLGLQLLLSLLFLMARSYYFGDETVIRLSFLELDLGWLYYPLAIILLLGIVNCANLTDGVDGLATSCAITIGLCFFLISYSVAQDASILSSVVVGVGLGFLFFNIHPAKIFMGDTGSLFFGALTACLAFSLGNPLLIVVIGGVYVIEGLSVIIQVVSYKLTKKRVFKMAPLHHHLEKCGVSENKICIIAILSTIVLFILSLLLFS